MLSYGIVPLKPTGNNETVKILEFYLDQFTKFPAFANVRTIKVFLNQLFLFQSIRIENILQKTGTLDYENLVNIKQEDFSYFTGDDFVNIIGSEDIKLYTP